jgi:thiamine-phosphate pyrophosphorylase
LSADFPVRPAEKFYNEQVMERATFRIIDANYNRAREALRLMEEFCRFALSCPALSSRAKQLRHELAAAIGRLDAGRILASRDTEGDVGTALRPDGQLQRANLADCVAAAGARLSEALRTLSEVIQIFDEQTARLIESLRYAAYTLEKDIRIYTDTKKKFSPVRLYVIISSDFPVDIIRLARSCAAGGADCIQLRLKTMDDAAYLALARELVKICRDANVLSIINDRTDIAVAAGADGVHLGQTDLPVRDARRLQHTPLIVGKSTHSVDELKQTVEEPVDYVGVGPVFATGTKSISQIAGLGYVRQAVEIVEACGVIAVAVGGITIENVGQVLAAGARAVAVSSAVCKSCDPEYLCRVLKEQICSNKTTTTGRKSE